jgi:hypothetical protein
MTRLFNDPAALADEATHGFRRGFGHGFGRAVLPAVER